MAPRRPPAHAGRAGGGVPRRTRDGASRTGPFGGRGADRAAPRPPGQLGDTPAARPAVVHAGARPRGTGNPLRFHHRFGDRKRSVGEASAGVARRRPPERGLSPVSYTHLTLPT